MRVSYSAGSTSPPLLDETIGRQPPEDNGPGIPRHSAFVDDVPMTVTGKIQKLRLREMAADRRATPDNAAPAIRL